MAQSRFNNSQQAGFTLIEVLVAVVVLAIALVAITRNLSVGIRDAQHIQDKNIAHWVALNVIARAQLNLIVIPDGAGGTQTGQEQMLNQTWNWKLQAKLIQDLPMKQITVQVFDNQLKPLDSLQTYLPMPILIATGLDYARQ